MFALISETNLLFVVFENCDSFLTAAHNFEIAHTRVPTFAPLLSFVVVLGEVSHSMMGFTSTLSLLLLVIPLTVEGDKWRGLAYAPNTKKFYHCPAYANNILIVDPATQAQDDSTIDNLSEQSYEWLGGVYAPNSEKLYFSPRSADRSDPKIKSKQKYTKTQ